MEFEFKNTTSGSDLEYLEDLKSTAKKYKKDKITRDFYSQYGCYHAATIDRRFGGWRKALEMAKLSPARAEPNPSEENLLLEFLKAWEIKVNQPTIDDIKELQRDNKIKYGADTYQRRFGGWKGTLVAFKSYINKDDDSITEDSDKNKPHVSNTPKPKTKTRRRKMTDKVRFRILARDDFKCKSCGRSPKNTRDTILHVDHIIPWSKGGGDEDKNLETKCSKCNLSKGNTFNV